MNFVPNTGGMEAIQAPNGACRPILTALELINKDLANPSLNQDDQDLSFMAGAMIAGGCQSLCATGCARDTFNRAQEAGIALPPDQNRDDFFELVSLTLASGYMESISTKSTANSAHEVVVFEMDQVDGSFLREVIERRINILKEPEILSAFVQDAARDGRHFTVEEVLAQIEESITPVAENAWGTFATFIDNNTRAGLALMSYFQSVFPVFRSDDPNMVAMAEDIAAGIHAKDEDWSKHYPGFRPADASQVTSPDFSALKSMVDERGGILLPLGYGSGTHVKITDDVASWLQKVESI